MVNIGERIRTVRMSAKLSQAEFAEKLGIHVQTANRLERSHRSPDADLLYKMWRVFSCDIAWVLTGEATGGKEKVAGAPLLERLAKDLSTAKSEMVIALPDMLEGAMAVKVEGDDMLPIIRDGDIVVFSSEQEAANGEVVLFTDQLGRARVRQLQIKGGRQLVAEHPGYPIIEVGDEITVVGKVIEAIRRIQL
jgi:transcriptional regulator with XRE-family HTH domain